MTYTLKPKYVLRHHLKIQKCIKTKTLPHYRMCRKVNLGLEFNWEAISSYFIWAPQFVFSYFHISNFKTTTNENIAFTFFFLANSHSNEEFPVIQFLHVNNSRPFSLKFISFSISWLPFWTKSLRSQYAKHTKFYTI